MPTFSERKGLKPMRAVLQTNSMDDALRNGLWSMFDLCYWDQVRNSPAHPVSLRYFDELGSLCTRLWLSYFKKPVDTLPVEWQKIRSQLRAYFLGCEWNEVYDFIEFVVENYDDGYRNGQFMAACNAVLERELAGYRFVSGRIVEITTEEEIGAIEAAIAARQDAVAEHLSQALTLLSDRKQPDYRNSIKESISAVEAICRQITGKPGATLGDALKHIDGKMATPTHPALNAAFTKLYGWTSDAKGIRHASAFPEDKAEFEDAKFMLVACSAFINYLRVKK